LRHTNGPAEFVTSFGGRIQSLARAHSLLSDTTWQGVDLHELVRDQLLLGPVDVSRMTAWGPAVRLEAEMALHMALMLHELGTNSGKYGALRKPDGTVTISWRVIERQLHFKWAERASTPVAVPIKRGFGTALIEQSAKGEGGSAQMSVEPEGIVWDIAMPLPQLLASYGAARSKMAATPEEARAPEVARAAAPPAKSLAGKHLLVIEDEPLLALDLVTHLKDAGATVAGPVGTAATALAIVERTPLDGALLDANLHGRPVDEIAGALTRRRIPFLFVTGYGRESLPRAFGQVAMLAKPFSQQQLLEAAVRLVERSADVVPLREK